MSHHTSVVFHDRMYLFGGSKGNSDPNEGLRSLDLKNFKWDVIPDSGEVPATRDEHTCSIYGNSMIIFGGFVDGVRTNDVY